MACRLAVTRGARNYHVGPDAHSDRRIARVDRHVALRPRGGPRPEPGQGAVPARPGLGAAVRRGISLSAGRLDRAAHRGRTVRTRLPARPPHGPEIARFVEALAAYRSPKAPGDAWRAVRLLANALFLRKFDAEYLEEMKGIADGAAAAGARFEGRPLDLIDIVTVNADIETSFLDNALDATATGLESQRFREP